MATKLDLARVSCIKLRVMEFGTAFQRVMEEARKVSGISDIERTDFYEPLKTIVYDLLHSGMPAEKVTEEAVSWLRQNVQIEQSSTRI